MFKKDANFVAICYHCEVENTISGKEVKFTCHNCNNFCALAKPVCTPADDFSNSDCASTATLT